MKTKTEQHKPSENEIINDISGIAHRWQKETREMVFRAVNEYQKNKDVIEHQAKMISEMMQKIEHDRVAVNSHEALIEAIENLFGGSIRGEFQEYDIIRLKEALAFAKGKGE